jgi:TPR repeat protein
MVPGFELLKQALSEDSLSHDRKLEKSIRESHARNYRSMVKRAFNQLMTECKEGNIDSMFRLGAYSDTFAKEGVANSDECLPWLKLAATKGHPEAPFNYALSLLQSNSPTTKSEGFDWLKRSTKIGDRRDRAAARLVHYYSYGFPEIEIKRNPKVAWEWAELGAQAAQISVGEFLAVNGLQYPDKVKDGEILFK